MNMKIGLSLNFKTLSLDGKFYVEMIDKYLCYEPTKLYIKASSKNWNLKRHRKLIETFTADKYFFFVSADNNGFMASTVNAVKKPFQRFYIAQDREVFNPSNTEIEHLIARKGFSCAYLHDEKYEAQQSALTEADYAMNSIPLRHAKGLPYKIDYAGRKIFDVSGNPGRSDRISSTELLACWKMWFGEEFYKLVPKERILSFTEAFKMEELANDVVFVQLFEKVEDSATTKAQELQWSWRKWLNFDELIEKNP